MTVCGFVDKNVSVLSLSLLNAATITITNYDSQDRSSSIVQNIILFLSNPTFVLAYSSVLKTIYLNEAKTYLPCFSELFHSVTLLVIE